VNRVFSAGGFRFPESWGAAQALNERCAVGAKQTGKPSLRSFASLLKLENDFAIAFALGGVHYCRFCFA
jgi:hypothetical protein